MTAPARSPQTDALIAFLAANTPLAVGDGKKPDGAGWQGTPGQSKFVGYLVVHSIPGGELDGNLGDPSVDSDLVWQVSSHGATRAQAEENIDRARTVLLASPPTFTIPGRGVKWIRVDIPAGTARQDPDQPAIWNAFERYRIATSPRST